MKLVLVAMLALPGILKATQCFALPYCARIGPASVFFIGDVIESHDTGKREFIGNPGLQPTIYVVRLRVVEAFVGTKEGESVTVFTLGPGTPGTRQFMEAWRGPDGTIRTSICPEMIISEESMLDFLRRGKQGRGDGTSLTIFSRDEHFRSVGATVSIHGSVERTAEEETKGGFRFEDIPAGHYQIDVRRAGYATKYKIAPIDVMPNSCGCTSVDVVGARRISGTVRTAEGKPESGARITVVAMKSQSVDKQSIESTANEFGRYEVANLPPGEYTVMAQPRELDLPVFFPGRSAAEAGTVLLEPNKDREIDFTLLPEIEHTVRFHFVDGEGHPLPNRLVSLWQMHNRRERPWKSVLKGVMPDEQATWTTTFVQNALYHLTWIKEYQETPASARETIVTEMELRLDETTKDVDVVLRRPGH